MNHNTRVYTSEGWHTISDSDPEQVLIDEWMGKIDTILRARTGYGVGYYPDAYYDDWYRLGMSPFWAACLVLDYTLGIYGVNPQTLRREFGIGA